MLLSSLEVRLGISGDAAVVSGLKRVESAQDQAAQGSDTLSSAFSALEIPALRLVSQVSALGAALVSLGTIAIAATGIKLAAQYERLTVGFTTLLHSASAAKQLMSDIQDLAVGTDYDALNLSKLARSLIATDSSGQKAINTMRTLRAVTDTAAATNLGMGDVGEIIHNMSAMRLAPHIDRQRIESLGNLGINIPDVYNAATGKNAAAPIAMARLSNMRGQDAFDTLIKGMEKLYGGSAAKMAATGLGLVQNIMETLGNVFLPTGKLLLAVLEPIGVALLKVLTVLKKANDFLGGWGGIGVIIIGLWKSWDLLTSSCKAAYGAIVQLTAALQGLAGAAQGAAVKTSVAAGVGGTAAAAGAGAAGISAAAGGAGTASGATGIKLLWQALKGGGLPAVATELKAMLGGVGKFLKSPLGAGLAGMGAAAVGGMMQGSENPGVKNAGDYLSNVGTGISLGSMVAMLLPGPWKIAAIALGGIAGGLKTWWDKSHEGIGAAGPTPGNPNAATNQILKDIHAVLIGGGDRANRVKSELEAEYALRHAVLSGGG